LKEYYIGHDHRVLASKLFVSFFTTFFAFLVEKIEALLTKYDR